MSKRISIAVMATLLSVGAINLAQAGPRGAMTPIGTRTKAQVAKHVGL
jgi:hypothetical protein